MKPGVKRVLLIAFFFPPTNTVGSIRPTKFAKYLPEFGWEPTVLTVDQFSTRPDTMPVEISPERIIRARHTDPVGFWINRLRGRADVDSPERRGPKGWKARLYALARRAFDINVVRMPDRALTWYCPALRRGLRLLAQQPFDAILSTSPPPTVHLVASTLARRTELPWVADFRDLWTMNHTYHRSQPWQGWEEWLERRVLRCATSLVTVSEPLARQLRDMHLQPITVITNGFDEQQFEATVTVPTSRFTITYTGSIYGGKQDPSPLFAALARMRDRGTVSPAELEVRFFGADVSNLTALVKQHGVDDFVKWYGFVPFAESVLRQKESSVLLFLEWSDPSAQGVYTMKIFEYLAAGRPVLALGLEGGSADRLLRACKVGAVTNSVQEIEAQLTVQLAEFRRNGRLSYQGDPAKIQKYGYRTLTGHLAQVLDNAARQRET